MERSRLLVLSSLLTVVALVAAACGGGGSSEGAGSGGGNCTWTVGTMGALSGDYASIGVPIEHGIEYAVDQVNSQGDLACKLSLDKEDSQGSPDKAPQLAQKLVGIEDLVAIVGPYFSGETLATGDIFNQAAVPFITPSATNETIDDQNWSTFFRAVGDDALQAQEVAAYITDKLGAKTVDIVHDNQDYSKGLAENVAKDISGATVNGPYIIDPNSSDYASVVNKVKSDNPDVVFYGGYTPQAAPLAKQLAGAGVQAQFITDDGSKDPTFGKTAGSAADGVLASCPCADPSKVPAGADFVKGMEDQFGEPPGTYAAEAYDTVNMIAEALKKASADDSPEDVRKDVVDYFASVHGYHGIVKDYTFGSTGNVQLGPSGIFIYQWSNDDFKFLGSVQDLLKS